MTNVNVEVSMDINNIVDCLKIEDKIELVQKLEKVTIEKRIDNLFDRIDVRAKKFPISEKEISRLVKETRKELYG